MCRLAGCVLVMAMLCTSSASAQGLLQRARDEALHPTNTLSVGGGDGNWFGIGNSDGNVLGGLIAAAIIVPTAPLWIPPFLLDDSILNPAYFPAHPYALDHVHYLWTKEVLPRDNDKPFYDPEYLKNWSVRISVENGNDFNGLNRFGGQVVVDTACRIGAQTQWNYYTESMSGGRRDETTLGFLTVDIRFAQSSWMQMHTGCGACILADRYGSRGGFDFRYSADVFPIDPVVISASVDLGNLDNAFLIHARATVGWQIDRFELFAGYDFLRIGAVNLQGPLAGVRLWF
jgi:hypothetical protein